MAASLLDLAVPGLGSALDLLKTLYAKYDDLRSGKDLCKRLGDRLKEFADELGKMSPDTIKSEEPLKRLVTLIADFSKTVNEYAEYDIVKQIIKHGKLKEEIELYYETLEFIGKMLMANHSDKLASLLNWREQFERDYKEMAEQLSTMANMQGEIWRALRAMQKEMVTTRGIEDLVELIKRELASNASDKTQTPQQFDSALETIVEVAEAKILKKKVKEAPTWVIGSDEVIVSGDAIDERGLTCIFVGEWKGVTVAVKKFDVVDESRVFDKHFDVWSKLRHPYVAQLYGAGSDNGAPFFVYDYASRQSLDRCWNQLTVTQIWSLLHQTSLALRYLHERRIVHGNLSCSKLLVTETNSAKLFGFNASYFRDNDKSNSLRIDSLEEFAAPECIGVAPNGRYRGDRHSPRFESDVYSFGLTIIEAITKQNPFKGMSLADIRELKQKNKLHQPAEVSDSAWTLVQQMCVCDPSQRVSIAYVTEQLGSFASTVAPSS